MHYNYSLYHALPPLSTTCVVVMVVCNKIDPILTFSFLWFSLLFLLGSAALAHLKKAYHDFLKAKVLELYYQVFTTGTNT